MSQFSFRLLHQCTLLLLILLQITAGKLFSQDVQGFFNTSSKDSLSYQHLNPQDTLLKEDILGVEIKDSGSVILSPTTKQLEPLYNSLVFPATQEWLNIKRQLTPLNYQEEYQYLETGHLQKIKEQHIKFSDSLIENSNTANTLKKVRNELQDTRRSIEEKYDSARNLLKEPLGKNAKTSQDLELGFQDSLRQIENLPLLQGTKLKESIIEEARNSLPENEYKLKESQLNEVYKGVLIKEKTQFKDRAYFEGLIGFNDLDFGLLQVAPAMGLQLNKGISIGLGLDGILKRGVPDIGTKKEAILGLKTFVKWEALKNRLYLQAENSSYFSQLSYLAYNQETMKENFQVPYVGGGYLLEIAENRKLNISLMHRLTDNPFFSEGDTSWLLRLGFSLYPNPLK